MKKSNTVKSLLWKPIDLGKEEKSQEFEHEISVAYESLLTNEEH